MKLSSTSPDPLQINLNQKLVQTTIRKVHDESLDMGYSSPVALWNAWEIYSKTIDYFLINPLTIHQQRAIWLFFELGTLLWCFTREGGKTMLGSHLLVFGPICGFDTMWIAAQSSQLIAAQKHLIDNPHVIPFKPSKQRDQFTIKDQGFISCRCATYGNVSGPHVPWTFYDETAQMDKNVWKKSLPISGQGNPPRRLYLSTPELHSLFHDLSEEFYTFVVTYKECHWLNNREIESYRKLMGDEYWKQEYLAIFTALAGIVFNNIQFFTGNPPDCEYIRQGIDLHDVKRAAGIRSGMYGGKHYILGEYEFDLHNSPKDRVRVEKWQKTFFTEAEDNAGREYFHLLLQCFFEHWDKNSKYDQISNCLSRPILINPVLTPILAKEINKCKYDDKGKVDTTLLCFVAAMIHSINAPIGGLDVKKKNDSENFVQNLIKNNRGNRYNF